MFVARTWEPPRCPPTHEWTRKLWYIYTVEYYTATTKTEFESVVMMQMILEPVIQGNLEREK